MGEGKNDALKVEFDPRLRLEFHGASVTSDAGLLAYRNLDEVLELTATAEPLPADPRTGDNRRHSTTALLRQAVYGRLAGYEDTNDAERLRFDLERCMLRRGNRYSSKYWRRVLCPVIERYRGLDIERFFRGDAAFEVPGLMAELEAEGFEYAIRIKENPVLTRAIEHLLKRPVGRPSYRPKVFYHSFMYRAGSWDRERRIVAKVEWHWDELLPRVGFIVTSLRYRPKRVVKFYNGRGTAARQVARSLENRLATRVRWLQYPRSSRRSGSRRVIQEMSGEVRSCESRRVWELEGDGKRELGPRWRLRCLLQGVPATGRVAGKKSGSSVRRV
jgi:hypothetical protein